MLCELIIELGYSETPYESHIHVYIVTQVKESAAPSMQDD